MSLHAPVAEVFVGEWVIAAPSTWRVYSARHTPYDVATVFVDNHALLDPPFEAGMSVEIRSGYRGQVLAPVFVGRVDSVVPDGPRLVLEARDRIVELEDWEVCSSFVDSTPQEIAEWIVRQGNISATIRLQHLPPAHRFLLRRQSALSALRELALVWGAEVDIWMGPDGDLYVGRWEDSPRAVRASLALGSPIVLERQDPVGPSGLGRCQLLAMPTVRHSQRVTWTAEPFLQAPIEARVEAVTHSWPPARTEVEWAPLS